MKSNKGELSSIGSSIKNSLFGFKIVLLEGYSFLRCCYPSRVHAVK